MLHPIFAGLAYVSARIFAHGFRPTVWTKVVGTALREVLCISCALALYLYS